ncbi:MAG: hypothetical protein KDE19_13120 [Caldilineaceae bacterium]|nr:hypothetical protein [Caldilineaceae bacterium]
MSPTTTVELELPTHVLSNQRESLQRSMIRHLLKEKRITMQEALALLAPADQTWLIETTIQEAQESLSFATQLTETAWRERYWQQYHELLGNLFQWHEQWSPYHTEILAVLRMVVQGHSAHELTLQHSKVMQMITARLLAEQLYREDVFAAEQALRDVGWETVPDLQPIADQLAPSYFEELGRV